MVGFLVIIYLIQLDDYPIYLKFITNNKQYLLNISYK